MNSSIRVSCNRENLIVIRDFVKDTLKKIGVIGPDQDFIILAVDEICANSIIHANDCNSKKDIKINIEKKAEQLLFKIVDNGKPFDASNYHEPNIKLLVERKIKGGVGMMIANKIMDSISFERKNNQNICHMMKHI